MYMYMYEYVTHTSCTQYRYEYMHIPIPVLVGSYKKRAVETILFYLRSILFYPDFIADG